jgi:hypothetical protein
MSMKKTKSLGQHGDSQALPSRLNKHAPCHDEDFARETALEWNNK